MVPETGLEPVRCCHRGILSPLRLPIPPLRQYLEAPPRFGLGVKVLQTRALPLGYGALLLSCLNKKMERETRFELATFALARQRSTNEPFPHIHNKQSGGNNRARTCDPLLVRQMLSQLSYAPKPIIVECLYNISNNFPFCKYFEIIFLKIRKEIIRCKFYLLSRYYRRIFFRSDNTISRFYQI